MSIKPILFSPSMVRAILEGRKTQTRRVVGPLLAEVDNFQAVGFEKATGRRVWETWCASKPVNAFKVGKHCVSPHLFTHAPGDMLYVREAWRTLVDFDDLPPRKLKSDTRIYCEADRDNCDRHGKYRQGMHMPRWASRITLKVTDVRVERLQDIVEKDAIAEGAELVGYNPFDAGPMVRTEHYAVKATPCAWFKDLWDSINAARNDGQYAWDKNPWIAAYTFEPIFKNVDDVFGPALCGGLDDVNW